MNKINKISKIDIYKIIELDKIVDKYVYLINKISFLFIYYYLYDIQVSHFFHSKPI